MLDATGLVQSANVAWLDLDSSRPSALTCVIGENLIDVCERHAGAASSGAAQLAAGIRSVLAGQEPAFSLPVPTFGDHGEEWPLVTVTGIRGIGGIGAVITLGMAPAVSSSASRRTRPSGSVAIQQFTPRLRRLSRLLATLGRVGEAIARTSSAQALYEQACRLAVEDGGLALAWVSAPDPLTGWYAPIAQFGTEHGFLDIVRAHPLSEPGPSPTARAAFEGRLDACNDLVNAPWKSACVTAAIAHGLRSVAAVPVVVSGKVHAVFVLAADVVDFFGEEENRLLHSLGEQLSFALTTIATRDGTDPDSRTLLPEQYYRELVEHSHDVVFALDSAHRVIFVNNAARWALGRMPAEMLGKSFDEFVSPRHTQAVGALLSEMMEKDGELTGFEIPVRHADGTDVYVSINARVLRRSDGTHSGVAGFARDVTERRLAEQEILLLNESLEARVAELIDANAMIEAGRLRNRRIIETSPIGIAIYDADGICVEANRSMLHHIGATSSAMIGTNFHEQESWKRSGLYQVALEVLKGDGPLSTVFDGVTAYGKHALLAVTLCPLAERDRRHLMLMTSDLSAFAESKAALEASETRYRSLVRQATDGIFFTSPEGLLTDVNEAGCRLMGRTLDQMLGRPFLTFVHQDDVEAARSQWSETAPGMSWESEGRLMRADGSEMVAELRAVKLDTGAMLGIARDVTERKAAEEALRLSEERFRLVSRATNDAIWDWDLSTDALWYNDAYFTLFGHRKSENNADISSWASRVHPEDAYRVIDGIHRAIHSGSEIWADEYRLRRGDGTFAYVLDRGHVIRDSDGMAVRVIGGMTDLTARKQSEERIAEQAALLDQAQDAILLKDLQGRVLFWSRGAERLYGFTVAEAVGRMASELHEADSTSHVAAMEQLMANGRWEGELKQATRDGRKLLVESRWTLTRTESGEPKSILVLNSDVTEKRRTEAQVLRAQRMDSLGTLAGGIAHDLNNVLAPVTMSLELLRERYVDAQSEQLLQTLITCTQRGADLVRQVLTFARGVEGERVKVNPLHLGRELQTFVRDTFPKSITFTLEQAPELHLLTGDPTQLNQVLLNLCVNARDAMPEGGQLTVSMQNVELDEVYAGMHPHSHAGRYVTFTVTDTGMGIPPELQERIFEPFFTTKDVGKGTGLGLSTCMAIVRSHSGFISLNSEPGRGTSFTVYIPAAEGSARDEFTTPASIASPIGHGELVLVVDDELAIREVAKVMLERFGYRVLLASHGAEALALYAQHSSTIDVVLTDMAMPIMDGPALIWALRAMNPNVRIVASSGLTDTHGLSRAVSAGVAHFVPKPYTGETMLRTLHTVLRGEGTTRGR